MALSISKENYLLHKLHSLTGVVPAGYYVVQHLTLNTFAIAGPEKFNGIIHFFDSIPKHFLLAFEVLGIWIPLLFHAVFGLFIAGRAKDNYVAGPYRFTQNRMFWAQRVTGVFLFFFLIYHVSTTTLMKYYSDSSTSILYNGMHARFVSGGGIVLVIYALGVAAAAYHLGLGIWNFCIRWGIAVSESAQLKVQKVGIGIWIAVTLIGWAALAGFFLHPSDQAEAAEKPAQAQNL